MAERPTAEVAARLLHAKAAELERMTSGMIDTIPDAEWGDLWRVVAYLCADISLVAGLLADEVERNRCTCPRIRVGMKVTEQRNLHPDCPVHGAQAMAAEDKLFGRDR